jgi:tRNA uridine 5-carbamoylmethylation protein Kti12
MCLFNTSVVSNKANYRKIIKYNLSCVALHRNLLFISHCLVVVDNILSKNIKE